MSLGLNNVLAQTIALSPAQVEEDVIVFISALKEVHPGLDLYLNQSEIDSLFEELKAIQAGVGLKDFYKLLLQTITELNDGHTDLDEGKLYREAYPYLQETIPFEFYVVNGEIYISKNHGGISDDLENSHVLAINGKSSKEILETLYTLTPSDGNNTGFKEAYNEKILGRQFAKFIESSIKYTFEIEQPNNSVKTINVNAVHDSTIHKRHNDPAPLTFSLNKSENYGILTVNTFQYRLIEGSGIDFHKFLKQSFVELRKSKVDNLIIDLRENYGGDNILALTLYSYLTEGEFTAMSPSFTKLCDTISVSRYSNFPNGNYPYKRTHEITFMDDGTYELKNGIDSKESYNSDFIYKGPNKKPENISKNKFSGTVYCLTSGLTFSAAANFSTLLSRNENALFIGQETGGSNGFFCGGGFYIVTLPNSQFVLQIPYMRRRVAKSENSEKGIGVIPDYQLDRELKITHKGEDSELMKAIEIIKTTTNKDYKK